jgi:hypothetical protein
MRAQGRWLFGKQFPIAAVVCLTFLSSRSHAHTLTLVWDPNPEPEVAGYIVYVGTEPGIYAEQFDVGPKSQFVYDAGEAGSFYFAVAAYAPGPTVGPRSAEVAFHPTSPTRTDTRSIHPILDAASSERQSIADGGHASAASTLATATPICALDDLSKCYSREPFATTPGLVLGIAPAPEGVFLAQADRVSLATEGGLRQVLALPSGTTGFTGIELDPQFSATHHVWVGQIETGQDGRASFSLVRYRELHGQLAEPAHIVTGISLADSAPVFKPSPDGKIYLAVPDDPRQSDPYEGRILRYQTDGSTPRDNPAAGPIFAAGPTQPIGLIVTAKGAGLYTGIGEQGQPKTLAFGPEDGRPFLSGRVTLDSNADLVVVGSPINGTLRLERFRVEQATPTAVSDQWDEIFLASYSEGTGMSVVERLKPTRPR